MALVRREAKKLAQRAGCKYVIIDGPPGIGCPVISAIAQVDLALIVSEPTAAGIHDLERVLALADHFGVETAAAINKYDLDLARTDQIGGVLPRARNAGGGENTLRRGSG